MLRTRQRGDFTWRGLVSIVAIGLLVTSTGCAHFFPSRPWRSDYIVNRGGVYSIGDRCPGGLSEVVVFAERPGPANTEPADMDTAMWHAVAESDGVKEFVLFSSSQDGVRVVLNRSIGVSISAAWVYIQDDRGKWRSRPGKLDKLSTGMVLADPGRISWDEYMAMPDADFGC